MAEVETDADAQQRRTVAKCMHHVPDNMNIKEGYNLMIMLYEFETLANYLGDLDNNDGMIDNGYMIAFDDDEYFNFSSERYIKIDPKTGRTTFLNLKVENRADESTCSPIEVPTVIEHFHCLEGIKLSNCQLLIMELGNLPLLKTIGFYECPNIMFQNIPEGLRFPSIETIIIDGTSEFEEFDSNLSLLLKIFSNNLKELIFLDLGKEQTNEILCVLQHDDDLNFRQSLTTIKIIESELNEADLEILMFDIRERFPNLRKIDVRSNNIQSLVGIEDRIKKIRSSSSSSSSRLVLSNNNLHELNLRQNDSILESVICNTNWNTKTKGPREKSALLTLLNTFNGISNLCYDLCYEAKSYDPDVEYALRINHAGRTFISNREISSGTTTTITTTNDNTTATAPIINNALWPIILERAYKKSDAIFDTGSIYSSDEDRERMKCATGLFDLVHHYWPMFTDRRCCAARWEDSILNNDNNSSCNDNDNRQQMDTNAALNCKRKRK